MSNNCSRILGAKIYNAGSYRECYEILKSFHNRFPSYMTVNNVHTVIESLLNPNYRKVINNSFLALPDGKPLNIVMKIKGQKGVERIFGPTFFENTLYWGQADQIKHYFFGSSPETLEKMNHKIRKKYPASLISGYFSPPYREFTATENELFIKKMNESGADIFWIGLGAPKQELWMYENYKKLNHGAMIGIGAGFDYLAGNTKHAPQWMKKYALEWFYRLLQEPKRLWRRYLVTNSLFLFYILLELLHLKKFEK